MKQILFVVVALLLTVGCATHATADGEMSLYVRSASNLSPILTKRANLNWQKLKAGQQFECSEGTLTVALARTGSGLWFGAGTQRSGRFVGFEPQDFALITTIPYELYTAEIWRGYMRDPSKVSPESLLPCRKVNVGTPWWFSFTKEGRLRF